MYIVTFYSFKGGVGRSMALVNVGVQLAQTGKKVLLVDFDLEAPGLPTFNLAKPDAEPQGLVEYVIQYSQTRESPDVNKFLYKSEQFSSGGEIWVMPAGRQDANYSQRLNSIDWQRLYAEYEGYIFFEDLKRQWMSSLSPNYVLIDSRTGHSDVEGICTRQLPDAVCLLFFPNEQNLQGLKRIVSNIRRDNERSLRRKITLHFIVSNVPDLDDEDLILGRTMMRFERELGYRTLSAEIHHYTSLSLLNQEIFSIGRPNSRLTKEYKLLAEAITKQNLADREAVIYLLKQAHRDITTAMGENSADELNTKIEKILKNFNQDGEVCYRVALVYEQIGNSQDALNLLSGDIVEKTYPTAPMYIARVRLHRRLNHDDEAVCDLNTMLDSEGADLESILEATSHISQLKPEIYDQLATSKAFLSLTREDRLFVASQFQGGEEHQLRAKISILIRLRKEHQEEVHKQQETLLTHELSIALIANGNFEEAVGLLTPIINGLDSTMDITNIFNLAMAQWGRDGQPPADLFRLVAEKDEASRPQSSEYSPNYSQCLAITHAILRNSDKAKLFLEDARNKLQLRPRREFSAWVYFKVTPKMFISHLEEIRKLIDGVNVVPIFVARKGEQAQLLQ